MRRLVPLISALLLVAGCGGEESGFTAEQFVSAVNQRGASLELGPQLRSTRPDAKVYALEIATATTEGAEEAHAGGSLVVMPDADAGAEEWERCDEAASLLCYRADNVVLFLEGDISQAQMDALANALTLIQDETSD